MILSLRVSSTSSLKSPFETRRISIRLVSSLDFASNLRETGKFYNLSCTVDNYIIEVAFFSVTIVYINRIMKHEL